MSLFSEIEKTIERGFRRWTERVFGPAESDELLLVHRAILEEIETKVQTVARGRRVFPYSPRGGHPGFAPMRTAARSTEAAFAEGGRLESDIREALEGAGCEVPRGFAVEVRTAEAGDRAVRDRVRRQPASPRRASRRPQPRRRAWWWSRGKAEQDAVRARQAAHQHRPHGGVDRCRAARGAAQRRCLSRRRRRGQCHRLAQHAHIRLDRAANTASATMTANSARAFSATAARIEVPAGNRRGELLRPGDEIYLGRACLRFER